MGKGKRSKSRKSKNSVAAIGKEQGSTFNLYILLAIVVSSVVGWLVFVS
ncbi:hypothetical protein [Bacteriovorax sp. Seq25_V]|nr:hypothetical protein [Bacteriovorax sp. Seq25_V]EQC47497.1 hypothetical protein M900_0987 [Bacteriovorax sp. Seq25_V]